MIANTRSLSTPSRAGDGGGGGRSIPIPKAPAPAPISPPQPPRPSVAAPPTGGISMVPRPDPSTPFISMVPTTPGYAPPKQPDVPVPVHATPDMNSIWNSLSNPYSQAIKDYEAYKFDYKPVTMADPTKQLYQNYGLDRQNAMRLADAATRSAGSTASRGLAATTGLSLADKQAMDAQRMRSRVGARQAAQNPYDQMQAQNMYETDKYNIAAQQGVNDYNQQLMNQYQNDKLAAEARKRENLYQLEIQAAADKRKLDAAAALSK